MSEMNEKDAEIRYLKIQLKEHKNDLLIASALMCLLGSLAVGFCFHTLIGGGLLFIALLYIFKNYRNSLSSEISALGLEIYGGASNSEAKSASKK